MGEIMLVFKWDGTVQKETRGFEGKSCVDKTKFLDDAIGNAEDPQFTEEAFKEDKPEQYKNLNK
jgi:hypothetical protein